MLGLDAASAGASSGTVVKEPHYGFSFRLPISWKQVPLDGGDVKSLLNAATHDDPALANSLDSEIVSQASKGMKVFAIGPVSGAGAPTVNVIVLSAAGSPSGRPFAQAAVAEAKIEYVQLSATSYQASVVTNQLGTTAMGSYDLSTSGTGGHQFGIQYFVRHKSHIDVITVTTASKASTQSAAKTIVKSWRW
jgi:hypothetical protein